MENSKGCEYCSGQRKLYQRSRNTRLFISTFGLKRTLETEANNCPPFARCSSRGELIRSAFPIKYCPECGRRL